mgnify:CR=1 FL=1
MPKNDVQIAPTLRGQPVNAKPPMPLQRAGDLEARAEETFLDNIGSSFWGWPSSEAPTSVRVLGSELEAAGQELHTHIELASEILIAL